MRSTLLVLAIAAGTMIGLFRCSDPVAGGTGTEVECRDGIAGRVVRPDGTPAAFAKVTVRPVDYLSHPLLADSLWLFWPETDTLTDDSGRFFVRTLDTGQLALIVSIHTDGVDSAVLIRTEKTADTGTQVLGTDTLRAAGVISGRVNLPISDDSVHCRLLVYGMERQVLIGVDRAFVVSGLPPGTYRIAFFFDQPVPLVLHYPDSVHVVSDAVTGIGTVNVPSISFFKGCESYACDSSAVRSILDTNQLAATTVDSVSTRDSVTGRITALDLNGLGIMQLPADVGGLSALCTLRVSDNSLTSLPPQIGYCSSLRLLDLDRNRLSTLPSEIGHVDSLTALSIVGNVLSYLPDVMHELHLKALLLDSNELAALPTGIVFLDSLDTLSLSHNHLSALPAHIAAWADSLDPDWRDTQR